MRLAGSHATLDPGDRVYLENGRAVIEAADGSERLVSTDPEAIAWARSQAGIGLSNADRAEVSAELARSGAILSGDDLRAAAAEELFAQDLRLANSAYGGSYGRVIDFAESASFDELLESYGDPGFGDPDQDYLDALGGADDAYLDALTTASAALDGSFEGEAARLAEDAERAASPPPRHADDRLAAAFARIERGTYTPQGQFALAGGPDDPEDLSGRFLPQNCDISDYFGRCSASIHAASCSHNLGNPAGLDAHEIEAWRAAMGQRSGPRFADLQPARQREDTDYHQLAVNLGIAGPGPNGRTLIGEGLRALGGGFR